MVSVSSAVAPVEQEQQAYEHAAQVCHVCHAVAFLREGGEEFDDGVADDEVFGFDGDGDGEDEHAFVGECHAEGE